MRHWFASEINFLCGLYKEKTGGGWEKDGSKTLVPDFTLTGHELPLPNWTLAKVPPINTGDRSEFQERAVELRILTKEEAASLFHKSKTWKYLDKEREVRPFKSADEVLDFLDRTALLPTPPSEIRVFNRAIEKLFDAKAIRINP